MFAGKGWSPRHDEKIRVFEKSRRVQQPWLFA